MKLQDRDTKEVLARMAYSRQQFKNRVEEKVGGALLENYKAECAVANALTRWVPHWRNEASRLLGELQVVLLHEIRGFKDRKKALEEVLQYLRGKDASYRRIAETAVTRDFGLRKLKTRVPSEAAEAFYGRVAAVAATALQSPAEAD